MIYVLNNRNFGKNIRFLREREKLSKEALSEMIDTCPEILEEIEQGNQLDIEYEMIDALVRIFHTEVEILIGDEIQN